MEGPDRVAEACPKLLDSEAAAAIVVTRNSLRVFIDTHFCSERRHASARPPSAFADHFRHGRRLGHIGGIVRLPAWRLPELV
jgi:hypothetical protein